MRATSTALLARGSTTIEFYTAVKPSGVLSEPYGSGRCILRLPQNAFET